MFILKTLIYKYNSKVCLNISKPIIYDEEYEDETRQFCGIDSIYDTQLVYDSDDVDEVVIENPILVSKVCRYENQ